MGGKTKQSQRTKNNARPSSSGRSALLLTNVKLESQVMNIQGTELPALFPTLAAPNIDPLVSPELQMCIKKLNKKDPITKAKALQELSELVSNSEVDDVVAALPSWTHFYKLLAMDPDRKVREATQLCHGVIMSACGRRVAPHLRQLLPHWLQAQYDEHAPAQAHAHHSLTKTFPDSKLPEVISFCKNEVMAHIAENLLVSNESTSKKKAEVTEQQASEEARAVAGSLHALRALAARLPRAQDPWLWAAAAPLLLRPAAWRRPDHADPRLRAAWYAAMGQLIQRFPAQFAEQYGQKMLRVLVGVKETSPQAAAQLWDCMLIFMHNVQEWHKYLDKKELLIKRILDVLENGGWGDAKHLSNMLLPLLANMPPALFNKEFYITFFNAMFIGFDKKTILSSKSERQSWITTLDECLRYLSIQQHDYVLEIVTSVHRTWLENILSDKHEGQTRTNLIKYSATTMAALVKYWLKQVKESNSEKYDQLIRNFWQNVGSTITMQIEKLSNDHTDIGKLIDGHILLLQTLKNTFLQEAKRQQSIKFDDDSTNAAEKPETVAPLCDASIVERYNHNLIELVEKICGQYFEFASKRQISTPVLAPIIALLVDFDSNKLFPAIARQFHCDSTYQLYDNVLRGWLAGDTMRCKAVIDITFLLMEHLSESERDAAFDSFKQFPPAVVEACMQPSLSLAGRARGAARRWLRGALAEGAVRAVCARVLLRGDRQGKDLLLLCLQPDDRGEVPVSKQALSKVVEQLSAAVCAERAPHRELVAALAAGLAGVGGPTLALGLFRLSVLVPRPDGTLTSRTWHAVLAGWQRAFRALAPAPRRLLLMRAAAAVHRRLRLCSDLANELEPPPTTADGDIDDAQDASVPLASSEVEHVVWLCPRLLAAGDAAEAVDFSHRILALAPASPRLLEYYVLRHLIVRGHLSCPSADGPTTAAIVADCAADTGDEVTAEGLRAYVDRCTFRAMYLRTVFLHKVEDSETWCDVLLADDFFVQEYCRVYRDFMVVVSMCDAYAFSPHYRLVERTKAGLEGLVRDITDECSLESKTRILNALNKLAASEGYFWAYARKHFDMNMKLAINKNNQETTASGQNTTDNSEENTANNQDKTETSQDETKSDTEKNDFPAEDDYIPEDFESLNFDNLQDIITGSGFFHTLQAAARLEPRGGRGLRAAYGAMLRAVCGAHAGTPHARAGPLRRDVLRARRDCGADVIVNLYYAHNHVMLYERDVSAAPWEEVASSAAVGHYLAELVAERGWLLPAHHWDFATISACHLLASAAKSKRNWGCSKVAMLTCAALSLYEQVERFVSEVPKVSERRRPSAHVAHLPAEWSDIFAPDLQGSLFEMFLFALESSGTTAVTSTHIAVLDGLIRCARTAAWQQLPAARRAGPLAAAELARACAAVLQAAPHHAYLYLAHAVLRALRAPLILEDADKLAAWAGGATEDGEERAAPHFSLLELGPAYARLQDLVSTALGHLQVCVETCSLVEFTDVHRLALGWLLLADCMTAQCRMARGDLAHHYCEIYRERRCTEPLLTAALRLLPEAVFARAQEQEPPLAALAPHFHRLPPLDVYEYCSARTVSEAACRGVTLCVCGPGAGDTRGWRGAVTHKHARLLDHIVRDYISPTVAKEEITALQTKASELENTDVIVQWASWEVRCVLTLEERPIELSVRLSPSHPLGLPRIVAPDHPTPGASHWLLMYMAYQNGSLVNAVRMWVGSVTQTVARAGHCYICYCRMHHQTGRLPGVLCHQCHNKYHFACLRKWFSTANKSNCPLCRTPF